MGGGVPNALNGKICPILRYSSYPNNRTCTIIVFAVNAHHPRSYSGLYVVVFP